MCMSKNYENCQCCGEFTHASELASNVSGHCSACEDYMNAVNPCMSCGKDFPGIMLSDNVGGCCVDCTLSGGKLDFDYDEHPGFDDNILI